VDGVQVRVQQQRGPRGAEARVHVGVVVDLDLLDGGRAQPGQLARQLVDQRGLFPLGVLGVEGDELGQSLEEGHARPYSTACVAIRFGIRWPGHS
jgi:hypothetical protein